MRGVWTLCLVALCACADPPRSVKLDEDLDRGGLQRVPSRRVGASYLRPGVDFAGYSKVRVAFAGVSYREPPSRARTGPAGREGNYALAPDQLARLERDFVASFERELVGSGLLFAAAVAGPEVLDVRGRIVDLVVEVPPETLGSEQTFVNRAGELTLLLEVVDAQNGRPLLRMADRRVLSQSSGSMLFRSGPVALAAELRHELSRWARVLRDRLAELRVNAESGAA